MTRTIDNILIDLVYRSLAGSLPDPEAQVLEAWLEVSAERLAWYQDLRETDLLTQALQQSDEADSALRATLLVQIQQAISMGAEKVRPVQRIPFLKRSWFRYAAAVLLTFGAGLYLWTSNKSNERTLAKNNKHLHADIAPGGEKAVLTLADGTKIILDSAANGNLAQQGNAQVMKLSNGEVVYNLQGQAGKEVMLNTMSTPAGGQYQVTLPDGTRVWLNAASSITYPTAFIGKERLVKISGEIYFEVVKNKQKPFIVDVEGKSRVEVLGTSFNINSYANESNIKTTLLEGSVRVISEDMPDDNLKGIVILKPGQQAQVKGKDIQLRSNVDISQALAWKNGLFNFNGSDLRSVMRQLERWYDIKVQYKGSVANDIFKGEMYRNAPLSDVLEMFREMDVKFRVEGKTLVVTD